ncbi:hypothetical protein, conserved [Trypanosoma brucei gambiense DAL972]|uniref:Uncharacterized protein n=1 Tax=Trypanosoma brucei gambiense (strain MHOM/CI/86/DAL972) TaxID=679716 RepID=D0A6D2_TRYB9|nr:hypothetical protein, conserved [Trypanosoma brucei gambiense DAL972]CBH17233.1 hypothetical protein, conserved [Trypanosoma brucei gambiense DAL972]|eukprot:XP_011779497.1 hypothetical protein, conserved [Trypanosoma brucei gambiense DAL972]
MSRLFLEQCPRRHLVINMDINKTIIQVDSAGGRTMEDVMNSNVAANVWGRVSGEGWTAVLGPGQAGDRTGLVTYDQYVDEKFKEPPGMQDLSRAEKNRLWQDVSAKRRSILSAFTRPGQPGEGFKRYVDEQRTVLTATPDQLIIPSFFEFINTLSELSWPFTLLFRTFGTELGSVLQEWREFVQGKHKHLPRGPMLQRLKEAYVPEVTGCIFRDEDDLFICYGPNTAAVVVYPEDTGTLSPSDAMKQLRQMPSCTAVYQTNFSALEEQLVEYASKSNGVAGIVDYYPYWAQKAESRCGGKVFPVATIPEPTPDKARLYVFFDDNISIGEDKSIVDLRDAQTGKSILDKDVEVRYTVAVNPYEAIVNSEYFVDRLAQVIQLQLGSGCSPDF